ncbi:MAG: SDR family NAD(P)-dependent oxidoreductase [Pseudomonadota bacterium]
MVKIAVITGASQGLGLETARQLAAQGMHVILTGRNEKALSDALERIEGSAEFHVLDVTDDFLVARFFAWLKEAHGRLDVLVNNAGRVYGAHGATLNTTEPGVLGEAIENNAVGAYRMMRAAMPLMSAGGYGRIVNVSSGMGALNDMGRGAIPYRVSKTALNALSILAAHEAPDGIKINAVCPGWVRTEMGGPSANRSAEEGAAGIVLAATLPPEGSSGGFFRDGKPIEW